MIASMPCGFQPSGSLRDLGHYKKCNEHSCKAKARAWDDLKTQAASPIKAILQRIKQD